MALVLQEENWIHLNFVISEYFPHIQLYEGWPEVMEEPGNHEIFLGIFRYLKKSQETSLLQETSSSNSFLLKVNMFSLCQY